jgi:hypothetical protein
MRGRPLSPGTTKSAFSREATPIGVRPVVRTMGRRGSGICVATACAKPRESLELSLSPPFRDKVGSKNGARLMDQEKTPGCPGVLGADDGTRTHDLLHGKQTL